MARKPQLPGADAFFAPPPPVERGPQNVDAQGDDDDAATKAPPPPPKRHAQGSRHAGGGEVNAPDQPIASTEPLDLPVANLHQGIRLIAASAQPPRSIPQPPTEKVTFYVPTQMLEQLEVCRVRLLTEHGLKVGRSQITQAALALTLQTPELLAEALAELARIWEQYSD